MFNNTKIAKAVRLAVVFGVSSVTTIAANAQNVQANENEEVIQVTGSRIARSELSQPTPVVTLEARDIQKFGTPDLGSILSELPAIGASDSLIGNNGDNAVAGTSSADLRSLGASRTLVLVNGKRHVAGNPGEATVDLSTIPAGLIERVEVITGGASAIYGSDAVSGVINVILKKDYDGFDFNVTGAKSTEGVNSRNHTISILSGTDLEDGNVTFFASYDRIGEVLATDIRQYDNWGTVINPLNTGEDDGIADRLRVTNVMSELIHANGVINPFGGAAGLWVFDDAGNPLRQVERENTSSFAFGNFPDGCDYCFSPENYENYSPEVEKVNLSSTLTYDITDNITFNGDVKFVRSDIKQQFQPSFRFGNISINVEDNAFLAPTLRQTLLDAGQNTVSMAKFFDELGNRSADNRRELFRYTAGFNGAFTLSETDFDWELYYVYGKTTNTRNTLNDLIPSNFAAAVDSVIDPATGEAVCRSQLASAQGEGYEDPAQINPAECVAFNPFGQSSSQAARDFVSADVTRKDEITQEFIGGTLVFDSSEFFELQGGPVGIATGFEYREETSGSTTDELTKGGFLTSAATPDSYGEYDVSEFFIEVSLPLLSGVAFAHELTLDGAFRSADYSHAGTAEAWKVGLMYAPFEDLRIRGTLGEAVRAPNITEAFDPLSPGFANVNDPCDVDNITDDEDRIANCAALGIPSGFEANDNVSVDLLSGGNANLESEESESLTIGAVWTPSYIEDFSLTLDYYDIEITDAITFVSAQNVVDNCVDATGGLDQGFCSQVDRDPVTNNISLVRSGYLNAAALNTKGIEAQARYVMGLGAVNLPGEVTMNLLVNKLLELEEFEFQDRPDEINVEDGEVGDPEWQVRFGADYQLDDLTVSWSSRMIDRSFTLDISPTGDTPEDTSPAFVGTIITHDLGFSYQVSDTIAVNAGIRNLTDKLAPGYITNALYDLVGRRAYAGINISL
ncbi:TonB-dependent receptor domain-containing protein [Thalassotalea montiporae]